MKKVLISMLVVVSLLLAVSCSASYTVAFNTMGGVPEKIASQTVAAGGVATAPTNPVKVGYDFTGWYQDEACTVKWDFANKVTKNMILYAGWTQATVYHTVTFETFGVKPVPEPQKVKHNTAATKPTVEPAPEKGSFSYWSADTKGLKGDYFAAAKKNVVTEDTTLYAQYDAVDYVTVVFDTNGGTPIPGPQTIKAYTGSNDPKIILPSKPGKTGFTFTGWYYDLSCATVAISADGYVAGQTESVKFTEDTILYAGYKAAYPGDTNLFVTDPKGEVILGWKSADEGGLTPASRTNLTSVIIPDGIKAIADNAKGPNNSDSGLFNGMSNLSVVYIPATLSKIGSATFTNCTGLKAIKLSTDSKDVDTTKAIESTILSVPVNVTDFGAGAFAGCTGFGKVVLLGADSLPANIFSGCTQITSISAPMAESVNDNAYAGMSVTSATPNTLSLVELSYPSIAKEKNLGAMSDFIHDTNMNFASQIQLTLGKDFEVSTQTDDYSSKGVNAFKVLNIGENKDVKVAYNDTTLNRLLDINSDLTKNLNVFLVKKSYGKYGAGIAIDNDSASEYEVVLSSSNEGVKVVLNETQDGLEDIILSGKTAYIFDMGGNADLTTSYDHLEELLQVENANIIGHKNSYEINPADLLFTVAPNVKFTQVETTVGAANDANVTFTTAGLVLDGFKNLKVVDEIPTGVAEPSTVTFEVDDGNQLVEVLNASNVIVTYDSTTLAPATTAPKLTIASPVTVVGKGNTLDMSPKGTVGADKSACVVKGLSKLTVENKDLVIKVKNDAGYSTAGSKYTTSSNFVEALTCKNATVVVGEDIKVGAVGLKVAEGLKLDLEEVADPDSYTVDATNATSFDDFSNLTVERVLDVKKAPQKLYKTTFIKVGNSFDAVKDVAKAKTPAIKVGTISLTSSYEFDAESDVVLYFENNGVITQSPDKEAANVTVWVADGPGLAAAFAGSTVKTVVVGKTYNSNAAAFADATVKAQNVDLNGFTVAGLTITKDGTTVSNGTCGAVTVNAGIYGNQVLFDTVKVNGAVALNGYLKKTTATTDVTIPGYMTLKNCTVTFPGSANGFVVNGKSVLTFDGGVVKQTTSASYPIFKFEDKDAQTPTSGKIMTIGDTSSINFGSSSIKCITFSTYASASAFEAGVFVDPDTTGLAYTLSFGSDPTVKYGDTWELAGFYATCTKNS